MYRENNGFTLKVDYKIKQNIKISHNIKFINLYSKCHRSIKWKKKSSWNWQRKITQNKEIYLPSKLNEIFK